MRAVERRSSPQAVEEHRAHAQRNAPRKNAAVSAKAAMILAALMSVMGAGTPDTPAQAPVKSESKEKNRKLPPLSVADIERLAEEMGDEDFATREKAYDALLKRLDKNTIAYLAPAAHSKDLEIAKRTRNILKERGKLIDAQFPLPEQARKQWFWTENYDDKQKFSHVDPEGEVMVYDRAFSRYTGAASHRGGKNSAESDWEYLKMALEQIATEKRDQAFLEAARWTDEDEETLDAWVQENRGGDRRTGKKLILDRKMSGVVPAVSAHIKPFVDASIEWRTKNPPRPMPPAEEAFWQRGWNPIAMESRQHGENAKRLFKRAG